MANEIYSVDIKGDHLIVGGDDEEVDIINFKNDQIKTKMDELEESVIFCKFLENGQFIVVTVAGLIALMTETEEISILELDEPISQCNFSQFLLVGTELGNVYIYSTKLEHLNTISAHETEILEIFSSENKVISLSHKNLIITDQFGNAEITIRNPSCTTFRYHKSNVFALGTENTVQIYKNSKKLFEYKTDGIVDSIEIVSDSIVVSGDFDGLILISMQNYHIFNVPLECKISKMKHFKGYEIIFSSYTGEIGIIDIRNGNSMKLYETTVETIFDFNFNDEFVVVGGIKGYQLIKLYK
ncbi:hypothetical protein NUSPORA_00534 [Nucleospora cyclopteri]